VIVSPSGSLLRLRSPVLAFALLDASLGLLTGGGEPLHGVRPTCRAGQPNSSSSAPSGGISNNNCSAPSSPVCPQGDQLVLAVATEKVNFWVGGLLRVSLN
jgi:hypothetical protein